MNVILYVTTFVFLYKNSCICSKTQDDQYPVLLFRQLFRLRRVEQIEAVKRILSFDSEEKQKKMLITVTKAIFTMIMKSKGILENSKFSPGDSIPGDDVTRDALSTVLENTALMGYLILGLPNISQSLLTQNDKWISLLSWSLNFSNKTQILDKESLKLIDLVNQKMNFTARSDNYTTELHTLTQNFAHEIEHVETVKKKKKKQRELRRGPRMSSGINDEL